MSPPTRVVWIEICSIYSVTCFISVTTHTGGVDWNGLVCGVVTTKAKVTTHTGGVDWNLFDLFLSAPLIVTTHTGGVDWN